MFVFGQPWPQFHVLFGEEVSGLGIETNEKRIGKVSFLQNTSLHNFLMSW